MIWRESGFKELLKRLKNIDNAVATIKLWYESFPANDNQTWALKNRKPEIVSAENEAVMNQTIADAATLAEESVKRGVLVTHNQLGEDLSEEIQKLLPEDIWDELSASAVATMDEAIAESQEERLAKAIAGYRERKAWEKAELDRMLEMAEAEAKMALENAEKAEAEEIGSSELDVEPKKGKEA